MAKIVLAYFVYFIFNVPVAVFVLIVPFGKRLNKVLKEKNSDGTASDATSYSRVVGAIGAIIMVAFYWALGNLVLYQALDDVKLVQPLLTAVTPFLLVGSALFLPYAFNQLKTLFPWSANASVALAQINQNTALALSSAAMSGSLGPARLIIANLSRISDADLAAALAAIQMQINADLQPEWGVSTILIGHRTSLAAPTVALDAATDAIVYLGDRAQDPHGGTAGVDDAWGYHDQNHSGVPFGFVFIDACEARGENWTVVLSHEILELLVDPNIQGRTTGPDPKHEGKPAVAFELEICDPVDGEHYTIAGIEVSNFVTKKYFRLQGRSPYTNQCKSQLDPFGLRPRGYIQYWDSDGVQIWNGRRVTRGQLTARSLMGRGRRNARRAAAGCRTEAQQGTRV